MASSSYNPVTGYLLKATFLILLILIPSKVAWVENRPQVVVTLPILQDFAQVIGQERVEVKSLLTGLESEHTYTPKPTDILAVKQAHLLLQVGLGLENWVNSLIKNASNDQLLIITTSEGIPLIKDVSNRIQEDRDDPRHSHSLGNPHIWLDPVNAKIMLRHIMDGLLKIDPQGKKVYLRNFSEYIKKLDRLEAESKRKVGALKDRRIITHHAAWPYFARRFGFMIEGNLINQVGSEPSAKALANLTRKIKQGGIKVIVSEPQLNPKLPQMVAQETGAKVVVLTPLPGAIPGTETYLSMIEYNINQLVQALSD
jgi:ABC-type Zn uptake system ZnuABC Zn-binding protein ZnuA